MHRNSDELDLDRDQFDGTSDEEISGRADEFEDFDGFDHELDENEAQDEDEMEDE
jgi:hypothetical protein